MEALLQDGNSKQSYLVASVVDTQTTTTTTQDAWDAITRSVNAGSGEGRTTDEVKPSSDQVLWAFDNGPE